MVDNAIGERVRERRTARKWSVSKLAQTADVSQGYISDVENGKIAAPSAIAIAKIAKALGTTTDYLAGISNDPALPVVMDTQKAAPNSVDNTSDKLTRMVSQLDNDDRQDVEALTRTKLRRKHLAQYRWLQQLTEHTRERMLEYLAAEGGLPAIRFSDGASFNQMDAETLEKVCKSMISNWERFGGDN